MSTSAQDTPSKEDRDETNDTVPKTDDTEDFPSTNPYLWTSAQYNYNDGKDCEFLGFEPCYIASIKNLEWQIMRKIQTLKPNHQNPSLADEMTSVLIQYSQLIQSLQHLRSTTEIPDAQLPTHDSFTAQYSGSARRITTTDSDRVRKSLADNIILIILNYIYKWDVANSLQRRLGNLTDLVGRIAIGVVGGASLLVPMIVMSFVTRLEDRLVIVSVATILFAVGVAFTSAGKEGVVGSTAAYAAIMVVYIGSSAKQTGM